MALVLLTNTNNVSGIIQLQLISEELIGGTEFENFRK